MAWADRETQLAELNRLKDELVMIAAHDIRAPLSVILGYSDILLNNETGLTEDGKEILGRIQASSNRLLAMVNNVLNLAALEQGRLELRLAPTRLGVIVHEVLEGLAGMVEERQVDCQVEVAGDDRDYALDAVKVAQILQNLVSNALKFSPQGGSIRIEVRGTPQLATFEVRDQGRGMTQEQAQRAFDKFVRFASGTATGSGLGLAIAKGLTELHGGTIEVETRRNEGSTFRFSVKPGHVPHGAKPLLG
jgi:signal transduction histidine kinase